MIAGGSDALSRIAFVGFQKLRAMSPDDVSPFDANRKGMMVGEGAAALLLERLSDAKRRGAVIYAEFLGYGLGCDAHKMSIPHPDGIGGLIALRNALQHAEILPDQIDYISAHGTGTRENDRIETQIIKTVLGSHAQSCSISSLKSMTGHCMGASSAIEAAACCLSLKRGILIPTINYTTPDPECDLDCIPNQAREKQIEIAVSNAYAFGGNTSSIVLQRFV
jgi:3-oxoacyl-[acyl-carrier-protein] synthase II